MVSATSCGIFCWVKKQAKFEFAGAIMIKPKSVEHFIETREKWQTEITKLREILCSMELEETIKWMFPCYVHNRRNVVGIAGFKSYFGLWFYEGASMTDIKGVLINAQKGKTKELRQWRMTSIKDIKVRAVKAYVNEAIAISKQPKKQVAAKIMRKADFVEVPPELHAALKSDSTAATAFSKLSVSRQRGYAQFIASAKRAETKVKRLAKVMPLIKRGVAIEELYRRS